MGGFEGLTMGAGTRPRLLTSYPLARPIPDGAASFGRWPVLSHAGDTRLRVTTLPLTICRG